MRPHRTLLERAADEIKDLMWRYDKCGDRECRTCGRYDDDDHNKDHCATAALLKEIEEACDR